MELRHLWPTCAKAPSSQKDEARAEPVGGAGRLGAGGLARWGRTHPALLPPLLQRVGRLRAEGTGIQTPSKTEAGPSPGSQ